MRRWETLAIAGAVATPILLAWLVVVILNTPAEGIMNKEQAIKIVSEYLAGKGINRTEPEATFTLIKYNGTDINGYPRFQLLDADLTNKRITGYNGQVDFSSYGSKYFSSELKDRFVWVVIFHDRYCEDQPYFVDAVTGELVGIGQGSGCPYCWHMFAYKT